MPINKDEIRWAKKKDAKKSVCAECMKNQAHCVDQRACSMVRGEEGELRNYSGIRYTSDGFDCALPVSIDSHSVCSFGCLYCFSDHLVQHRQGAQKPVGQTSLSFLEAIFSGGGGARAQEFRNALKYDRKDRHNGYPCPVQLGAITDPLDNIERNQGWFLQFAELAKEYNQPVRISTKGNLFLTDEYLSAVRDRPEMFWVAFSIITCDDDALAKIDLRTPPPSERLKAMKRLSDIGVSTSLRFRPILPGISDRTPKYPQAYRVLCEMAAEAGAKAISYEVGFTPGCPTKELKNRWKIIEKVTGVPMFQVYRSFGKTQACTRPPYTWTEEIMHAIAEEAKKNGLTVAVSDPNWKQLGESGCCCGILPDDPVFGNWQRRNATHALLEAKKGNIDEITIDHIVPRWAWDARSDYIVNPGVGPKAAYEHRHHKWSDKLLEVWDNLDKERNPLHYLQGALVPVRRDEDGHMVYRYEGLERQHPDKTPYWRT